MGVKGWILVMVLAAGPVAAQEADADFFGGSPPPLRSVDDPTRRGDEESRGHGVFDSPAVESGAAPAETAEPLGISPRFESNTFSLPEEGSLIRSTLRTVTAVGFVLALIFGLAFFVKRYVLKGAAVGSRGKFIRVVDTLFLGPRKNLMVVEAFGDKFLVATVGSGLQFLSRVNEHRRETRPVVEEEAPAPPRSAERRSAASGADPDLDSSRRPPDGSGHRRSKAEWGGVPLAAWKKTMMEELQRLKRQA